MNKLFAELKRRNVIKVVTAYVIAAWISLQMADMVREPLGMPDWVFQAILVALGSGLVLTITLSWIFEITPDGIKKTPTTGDDAGKGFSTGRKIDFIIIALLLVSLLAFVAKDSLLGPQEAPPAAADADAVKSIAVLPFVSMSSDIENEYFSDGLSEELLNMLANIKDLKVAGRTSSFYYKGRDIDLREIGSQLNVNHVLEGSVRKSGNQVRITAQLVSVADGYHVWSETYDRQLDDIFKIQEEIARAVTAALKVTLLLEEDQALATQQALNPAAHSMYLIARSRQRERGLDNLEQAMHLFENIIEDFPDFAPAYSGLSDSILLLSNNHLIIPFAEARGKATPLIEKALQLAPFSSDAWTSKGFLDQQIFENSGDSDYLASAEAAYLKAQELDPNNAQALYWHGILMDATGNYKAAIEMFRQSLKLDPLARIPRYRLALDYQQAGHFDEARAALEESFRLYPDFTTAKAAIGTLELSLGNFEAAESILLEIADSPAGGDANIYFSLFAVYSNVGEYQLALDAIEKVPPSPLKDGVNKLLAAQQSHDIGVLLATTAELAASDGSPLQWKILAAQVEYLAGDFEKSRQRLAKDYPVLFSENPEINLQRVLPATIAAAALKKLGETEQADRLLQLAQAIYESKWPDYQPSGVHYRLAELLAIKGDKDAAMRHLQAAYDEGFRLLWTDFSYPMDGNPYFGELLADQRFVALVEKIRVHNEQARQRIVAAHAQSEQA
ncbi:MAG: tetratricopeptide repeat protein [Proteobacteria bacterium]|nr:tetratricopeptide repeat protein [Pseudomonadota bacterium]